MSGNPTTAGRVAVAGGEVAHKHSSDVLVVHGRKHGTQVGIRGKWETWPLVRLAGDENIQKMVFARDLVRELLESVNGGSRASEGCVCMSYATLGVDRKDARVLGVAQVA